MFRKLRIAILLFILASVAVGSWKSNARSTAWDSTLHVTVYPIAADPSDTSRRIVADLKPEDFAAIGDWLETELHRLGRPLLRPVAINLAPPLASLPPPFSAGGNALAMMSWSLQLRFWAWRHDAAPGPQPDVRLFLLYHDPALTPSLDHSVGLEKGKLGVVKVFASRRERQRNAVVIAHELLHTLGATDKYDLHSLTPQFPAGYAAPGQQPRYPQTAAEIMAGRIPLSAEEARIPDSLAETLIGPQTAREIGL